MRLAIFLCLFLLSGCATTPPGPSTKILGDWQSDVGGFTVTTVYTATTVTLQGHDAMPYIIEGDRLTIDGDAAASRIISFPTAGEMIQLDPLTGVRHRYVRTGR